MEGDRDGTVSLDVTNEDDDFSNVPSWLLKGDITQVEPLPAGSNYSFAAVVRHEGRDYSAVYKPRRGEAPLWDFPIGTLYRRERAAYLLTNAIGWRFVPATIVRKGPYGVGSVQVYVPSDAGAHYFTLLKDFRVTMKRIAVFDLVANNADRKAGHCLLGPDGRVWAIDHGLTFHVEPKLRTVIWDFAGEAVPPEMLAAVGGLCQQLASSGDLTRELLRLLSADEVGALVDRIDQVVSYGRFPRPSSRWSVPWPLV